MFGLRLEDLAIQFFNEYVIIILNMLEKVLDEVCWTILE